MPWFDGVGHGFLGLLTRWALSISLSGSSGIRATIPLFVLSLLHQTNDFPLSDQASWMSSPFATAGLGVLVVVEVLCDMIPAVDHVLHGVMTVVHPVAGCVVALAPDHGSWLAAIPLAVIGGVVALFLHILKAATRLVSTASSGGVCNPCVSLGETIATVVVVALCFVAATIAVVVAVAVLVGAVLGVRRFQQKREERAARGPHLIAAQGGGAAVSMSAPPYPPASQPYQASAPGPQMAQMESGQFMLTVPHGVAPGATMQVTAPNGQVVQVTVPPGVAQGQQFIAQH